MRWCRAGCSEPSEARDGRTVLRREPPAVPPLRGAGAALALPLLEAMQPAFARAAPAAPHRLLAACTNMGILPQFFFPATPGEEYEATPYLDLLKPFRTDLTVFSGVSHPDVDGGHPADNCFLTAAPHPARGGFKNTVSLDLFAAERIGTSPGSRRSRSRSGWRGSGACRTPRAA